MVGPIVCGIHGDLSMSEHARNLWIFDSFPASPLNLSFVDASRSELGWALRLSRCTTSPIVWRKLLKFKVINLIIIIIFKKILLI